MLSPSAPVGVMRQRDAVDYALLSAVTLLVYLQLPFRPAIRRVLRGAAGTAVRYAEGSPTAVASISLVVGAVVAGGFVLAMVRHASA